MHSDPQRAVGDLNCRGRLSSSNLDERILWSHPGTGRCAGDSECAERRGGGYCGRAWWKARSADRSGRRMTFERVTHYYHGGHSARNLGFLALGAFAVGTEGFMIAGLLP